MLVLWGKGGAEARKRRYPKLELALFVMWVLIPAAMLTRVPAQVSIIWWGMVAVIRWRLSLAGAAHEGWVWDAAWGREGEDRAVAG